MIFTSLGPVQVYRVHNPKWASNPTSGRGAATHGGRANRIGVEALYLSLEQETALGEYQQLSTLMPPGTIVSYTISVDRLVDFRNGYDAANWSALWRDFDCDWRSLWFNDRIEPPSWILGDEAIDAGAKGILFTSSVVQGGTNMVLYTAALGADDVLQVNDAQGLLPKNQDSWT